MSGNFSSAMFKTIFDYTFPYYSMFAVHAVNYNTYGIWTSLKNVFQNVLIPLGSITDFWKVNGVKC